MDDDCEYGCIPNPHLSIEPDCPNHGYDPRDYDDE